MVKASGTKMKAVMKVMSGREKKRKGQKANVVGLPKKTTPREATTRKKKSTTRGIVLPPPLKKRAVKASIRKKSLSLHEKKEGRITTKKTSNVGKNTKCTTTKPPSKPPQSIAPSTNSPNPVDSLLSQYYSLRGAASKSKPNPTVKSSLSRGRERGRKKRRVSKATGLLPKSVHTRDYSRSSSSSSISRDYSRSSSSSSCCCSSLSTVSSGGRSCTSNDSWSPDYMDFLPTFCSFTSKEFEEFKESLGNKDSSNGSSSGNGNGKNEARGRKNADTTGGGSVVVATSSGSVKKNVSEDEKKKKKGKAPLLGPTDMLNKDGSVNLIRLTDSDDPLSQERFWSLRKGKPVMDRDGDSIVFAYREGRFIRGLTLESLAMLTAHGTKTNDISHPGSQVPIPPQDLKRGLECMKYYLSDAEKGDHKEVSVEEMALEIFHAFSRISIFLDEKEFLRLNAMNLRECMHELTDMFAHNFTSEQRKFFFPPDGKMIHRESVPSHTDDLETWRRFVLNALRPLCLPKEKIPDNLHNMGLYVALGALSVVCREYRKRYDSFSYEFFVL